MNLLKNLLSVVALVAAIFTPLATHAQQSLDAFYPTDVFRAAAIRQQIARKGYLKANGVPIPPNQLPQSNVVVLNEVKKSRLGYLHLAAEGNGAGQCAAIDLPQTLRAGLTAPRPTTWGDREGCSNDSFGGQPVGQTWSFSDSFTFTSPTRRKTWDGMEYEASAMVQKRNGEPWLTTYWGYRMGLVESKFDWDSARLRTLPEFAGWPGYAGEDNEFVLVTLPPTLIDGEVTEYLNSADFPNAPFGVFFYASNDTERAFLESGRSGRWVRTGKRFHHGGYVSVCRFYGSVSPGPNSHFYTASEAECDALKRLAVVPPPKDRQQLNYEGKVFYANLPLKGGSGVAATSCPAASIPLYRAYNAAWGIGGKKNYDSNHRYSTSVQDITEVVNRGWINEGIVMCVPAPPTTF